MTRKHLIEGAVILGTAQCQHLVAVDFIPPGTRTLEPYVANKFVGRFDATTAQWIAPSTELLIGGSAPVLIEIVPTIGNRFFRFVRAGLHASQSAQHPPHFAHIQSRHRGFNPFQGLHRCPILGLGHPMEILRTMIVVEHLTSMRKQSLDVFPYPGSPIADHAKPYLVFRNPPRLFDLLEGLAELVLRLHLMPTQHMDDALPINEIKAKPFGITPLAAPQRPLGPMAALAGTAPPGTLRPRRHIGPINAQHQDRTAQAARCYLRDTPCNLVA